MFTTSIVARKDIRIFSISFDKEGQPNIVEIAEGKKQLPPDFPVDTFLVKYIEWKMLKNNPDESVRSQRQSLFGDLRDLHQKGKVNKKSLIGEEEMELFGEFLESLKGTRINNLSGAVFAQGSGTREGVPTAPSPAIDISYDSEYGDYYRSSRDYARGKYVLPSEGAYIQEPREGEKAIVIWNRDKNTIHSIIVDGVQYIGKDGAFRNGEGKTITVTHDPAKKTIQVRFSAPVMARPAPGAPVSARPDAGSPVMARPAPAAPAPLPPPVYQATRNPAPAAPLEDRDERTFQEAMKGVSFIVNGKGARVLQVGQGAEGLRVQVQVGETAIQQIQQTIVFKKESGTYRVIGNVHNFYTVKDETVSGKRTITLTAKSPTPDRAPAPAPAVPVAPAPAPAPRPTGAPVSDAPRQAAPARVERSAEQVFAGNKKFIDDNQRAIDAALAKAQDPAKKTLLEGYLKDPTNGNIRKLQELVGANSDGDFRGLTLAALVKWAGADGPAQAPEAVKPLPEIKVGQTLDEYIKAAEKAGHKVSNGLSGPQVDGSYIYLVNKETKESVYLYFDGGDVSKKIVKIEKRQTPTTFKVGSDVGPAMDTLNALGYEYDPKKHATDASGVHTAIFIKKDERVFTIRHKDGKIVSVDNEKIVPAKKEVTKADLESWKDKLGDGIKYVESGTENPPTKIGETVIKSFINLEFQKEIRSYVVIGEELFAWDEKSSTWTKSEVLEIRDGKIEKVLPKKESIEDQVKKMKKVTLDGLGDAYKDIVPEYDSEKKTIFFKAPFIETPKGVIRNYIGITEEQFLAGNSVSTGTIAFVKGLYNLTITPVDGELVVKLDAVKPEPRTKPVELSQAEQITEATKQFQNYLDTTDYDGAKLSTRIKRPDTALRWVDTKDKDFAVGIDIATGKSFARTNRKWDKELTQFEQSLWDNLITFSNRAAKMTKQVPDTSDPYAEQRKQLATQLKAPPAAPVPAPVPAPSPPPAPATGAASAPEPAASAADPVGRPASSVETGTVDVWTKKGFEKQQGKEGLYKKGEVYFYVDPKNPVECKIFIDPSSKYQLIIGGKINVYNETLQDLKSLGVKYVNAAHNGKGVGISL